MKRIGYQLDALAGGIPHGWRCGPSSLAGFTPRPTAQRVLFVCALIFIASTVGMVLALIFEWPHQIGGGSGRSDITTEELILNGTLTSMPLGPWIALTVFAHLARSQRWWGALAVVGLCLLSTMFIFLGGLGQVFAPSTPFVPRVILVAGGGMFFVLGLALLLSGIADLRDRSRARRQPG